MGIVSQTRALMSRQFIRRPTRHVSGRSRGPAGRRAEGEGTSRRRKGGRGEEAAAAGERDRRASPYLIRIGRQADAHLLRRRERAAGERRAPASPTPPAKRRRPRHQGMTAPERPAEERSARRGNRCQGPERQASASETVVNIAQRGRSRAGWVATAGSRGSRARDSASPTTEAAAGRAIDSAAAAARG